MYSQSKLPYILGSLAFSLTHSPVLALPAGHTQPLPRDDRLTLDGHPMHDIPSIIQAVADRQDGRPEEALATFDPSGVAFLETKKEKVFADNKGDCTIAIFYQGISERYDAYKVESKNETYPWYHWASAPNGIAPWCEKREREPMQYGDNKFQTRFFNDTAAMYVVLDELTIDFTQGGMEGHLDDWVKVGDVKSWCDGDERDKCEEYVDSLW